MQEGTRALEATNPPAPPEVLPKGQRRLKFEDFEAPTTRVYCSQCKVSVLQAALIDAAVRKKVSESGVPDFSASEH